MLAIFPSPSAQATLSVSPSPVVFSPAIRSSSSVPHRLKTTRRSASPVRRREPFRHTDKCSRESTDYTDLHRLGFQRTRIGWMTRISRILMPHSSCLITQGRNPVNPDNPVHPVECIECICVYRRVFAVQRY